ncbi:hypothetical protein F2Q69_00029694 [Brassica cretica]|uniref:Uncharacterized protein n=1 Tax=Brassica cretica TaxID=69181 RepID=A0A8S9S464_BRACR|nr:hypothetical protein F2Q69_00029694 [Brassica cretica]
MEEVNTLFDGAISTSSRVNKLTKLEDPGKCVVPYTILGDEFLDAPCATWSIVILVSKDIAERLAIPRESLSDKINVKESMITA